jgi:hypothetical protein
MAHFLHNALYLLGPAMHRSAMPAAVTAELARAYRIESADTAACRVVTDAGCEVLFLASHVTWSPIEPMFRIECERGIITCGESGRHVEGTGADGRVTDYGDPDATPQFRKLVAAIDRVRSQGGGSGEVCGVEAASAQTICVNAMHESAPEIVSFPPKVRRGFPDHRVHVVGLDEDLLRCYRSWVLPSEIGCAWAAAGRHVLPTLPRCMLRAAPAWPADPGGRAG